MPVLVERKCSEDDHSWNKTGISISSILTQRSSDLPLAAKVTKTFLSIISQGILNFIFPPSDSIRYTESSITKDIVTPAIFLVFQNALHGFNGCEILSLLC